jgi:hypothetical protein
MHWRRPALGLAVWLSIGLIGLSAYFSVAEQPNGGWVLLFIWPLLLGLAVIWILGLLILLGLLMAAIWGPSRPSSPPSP